MLEFTGPDRKIYRLRYSSDFEAENALALGMVFEKIRLNL